MKIKRRDLNRIIESYLKDHMLLTTSLSGQATLKEYSFGQLADDIEALYDDASDYVSDVVETTSDVLSAQYDLITDYYTNVSFEQVIKDATSMTLAQFQEAFDALGEMGFLDAIATEVGIEIVAIAAFGPAGGIIAALILALGPMFVPIGLEMLEGKPFDQIMLEDILEILQMGLDQGLLTLEDAKAFLGGGEKLKIVSTINEGITLTDDGQAILTSAGQDLITEPGWFAEVSLEFIVAFVVGIFVIGALGWAFKHVAKGTEAGIDLYKKLPDAAQDKIEDVAVDTGKNLIRSAKNFVSSKSKNIKVDVDDVIPRAPESGFDRVKNFDFDELSDDDLIDIIPSSPISQPKLKIVEPTTRKKPKTAPKAKAKSSDSGSGSPKSSASRITKIQQNNPTLKRALIQVDQYQPLLKQSVDADSSEIRIALGLLGNRKAQIDNALQYDQLDDVTMEAFKQTKAIVDKTYEYLDGILAMKTR